MTTEELLQREEELEEVAGGLSGEVGAIIIGYLVQHVYPNRLGRVFNANTDFEFFGTGKRQPDVAFVSLERLPENTPDAVPLVPDLAVEVLSKTDQSYASDSKVLEYLRVGVKLVWIVRPILKIIEIYHPGDVKPTTLGIEDELDGENVIPGFKLKISKLFEY